MIGAGAVDIELEQFSSTLHRIKVDVGMKHRFLNRSNVKKLLEVDENDYRTIYGENHIFRPFGTGDPPYGDISTGISWGTADFNPRMTDPEDVASNLEALGEAVLEGEIEPPLDESDRQAVIDPREAYSSPEAFRSEHYSKQYEPLSIEEDETSLTITEYGGPSTVYRFMIMDKPGDEGDGTVLHRGTEEHTRSGDVRYRTEDPSAMIQEALDDMGYPSIQRTELDREKLERSAALRQLGQADLQDESRLYDIIEGDVRS